MLVAFFLSLGSFDQRARDFKENVSGVYHRVKMGRVILQDEK